MNTLLAMTDKSVLLGTPQGEMMTLSRTVHRVDDTSRDIRLDHCDHPIVTTYQCTKVAYLEDHYLGALPPGQEAYISYRIVELKRFQFEGTIIEVAFDEVTRQWWVHDEWTVLAPDRRTPVATVGHHCPLCGGQEL